MNRKFTISMCPTCYKEVVAGIEIMDGSVWMVKSCCGKETRTMIERDAEFYQAAMHLEDHRKNPFIDWIMVECTSRCNASCSYCYHDRNGSEASFPDLMNEISIAAARRSNICLTGGEPTMRDDLPRVLTELGGMGCSASMVTNGIRLADGDYLDSLLLPAINHDGVFWINLSLHTEAAGSGYAEKQKALENIKARGLKIADLFFTIDSLDQIGPILEEIQRHKDHILGARIRSATNIYKEGRAAGGIFVSDIFRTVKSLSARCDVLVDHDNNMYHLNVMADGVIIRLISWPDVSNIDLMSISSYGPVIKAKTGMVCNLLQAQIINEGMDKGYIDGRKFR